MNFLQALQAGEKMLKSEKQNTDVAKLLILHLTKMQPADLYASLNAEIDFDFDKYHALIQEYVSGVPLQHIRGYEYFYGRKFKVSRDVFIPRPETELLCDVLLERIADATFVSPVVADLGTGSGAIAITLKLELKNASVYATELSDKALLVAKENAHSLGADVVFLQGSFGQPLIEQKIKLDVLVCNPPYIPSNQKLEVRVADHDPNLALYGGVDGLDAYRQVFDQMPNLFRSEKHWLACFEIGFDQKEALEYMVKERFKQAKVEFIRDYANLWRIMIVRS